MSYEEKIKEMLDVLGEIVNSGESSIPLSSLKLRLSPYLTYLKQSEDEKIRKEVVEFLKVSNLNRWADWLEKQSEYDKIRKEVIEYLKVSKLDKWADWLEKQGKETSEISNDDTVASESRHVKYDTFYDIPLDYKKSHYASILRILEYAKTLDTYNEYGKDEIDEDIKWLKSLNIFRYHCGDVLVNGTGKKRYVVLSKEDEYYCIREEHMEEDMKAPCSFSAGYVHQFFHKWTIHDVRPGDVISFRCNGDNGRLFLVKDLKDNKLEGLFWYDLDTGFKNVFNTFVCTSQINSLKDVRLANKEESDLLFRELEKSGYTYSEDYNKLVQKDSEQ